MCFSSFRPPRYRRLAMDDAPFVCRRAALTRVYRHTTGAQPIEPEHMQNDSDDEIVFSNAVRSFVVSW